MIKSVLVFMMLSCGPGNPRGFAFNQQPPAPLSAGLRQGGPAALPEAAASAASEPAIITINGDDPATSTVATEPAAKSAAPSAEEAAHEDEQTQEQASNPETQPRGNLYHRRTTAPSPEPANENSPAQVSSMAVDE
jgi:hypothetical protein